MYICGIDHVTFCTDSQMFFNRSPICSLDNFEIMLDSTIILFDTNLWKKHASQVLLSLKQKGFQNTKC